MAKLNKKKKKQYLYIIDLDNGTQFLIKSKFRMIRRVVDLHYRHKLTGTVSIYRLKKNKLPVLKVQCSLKEFLLYELGQLM